jgi:hypothetical protein
MSKTSRCRAWRNRIRAKFSRWRLEAEIASVRAARRRGTPDGQFERHARGENQVSRKLRIGQLDTTYAKALAEPGGKTWQGDQLGLREEQRGSSRPPSTDSTYRRAEHNLSKADSEASQKAASKPLLRETQKVGVSDKRLNWASSRQFRRFHANQPTAAVNVVAAMTPPTEAFLLPSHIVNAYRLGARSGDRHAGSDDHWDSRCAWRAGPDGEQRRQHQAVGAFPEADGG